MCYVKSKELMGYTFKKKYNTDEKYQEYLIEDRWKCSHSPTGAHHWKIDNDKMKCAWCHKSKKVSTKYLPVY